MSKEVKQMMINSLAERFHQVEECVIVDISTLDSEETVEFRGAMRDGQIDIQGVKASIARRAFQGSSLESAASLLKGHSFIATGSTDVVALAKALVDWAKENEKLVIKGAIFEGKSLDASGVQSLSKLPSREELLAGIVQSLLGGGLTVIGQLASPGMQLAGQLKAMVENLEQQGA